MIQIRPVSDLRNKFPEIEQTVLSSGEPVFLTKNGYGSMVVMSIEQYAELIDEIEMKLEKADKTAMISEKRYTADEVFSRARRRVHGR